jgi:hypothetical protein
MDCSTIKPVVGCWSKADGSFESVSIHYEYATAASGEPIVKSTRYTKADGGDIITVPVGDTVTVGACSRTEPPTEITPFDPLLIVECTAEAEPVIPQSSSRKICAMMDLAGTPTKVNILEVSTPQADGTTVTTYLDPHVSPMVDVTAQFISFENDGKCPCTINGTIPAADVVDVLAGSLGIIAGASRSATAAFTGAPATVNTAGITGKLQSITVTASGVTDGTTPTDSVTVTLPSGVPLRLFDGQSFTWSVARNQDDEVLKPITVTATGNAYANVAYTAV